MNQHHQTCLLSQVQNSIQGGVGKACDAPRDLAGDKLFVNRELADSAEHAGKSPQRSANVSGGIHIRRIKPRNHRIKSPLLLVRERQVSHSDRCVGKRVVVQRRICIEVVSRLVLAADPIGPLLLQRNAEQDRSASGFTHDAQICPDRYPFLNVVRQVKMGIVELVSIRRRPGVPGR